MKALVICGGSLFNKDILIKKINKQYDCTIAVDSGYNYAKELDIEPTILIGDLDSIKKYDSKIPIIEYSPIKDDTDLKLALDYCIDNCYKEIDIICATGKRIDHMLNNISLLSYLDNKNIVARIIDEYNTISVLKKYNHIDNISKYVSIIPITEKIVYSSNNLIYKADRLEVKNINILSISNQANNITFDIELHNGKALLIQSD